MWLRNNGGHGQKKPTMTIGRENGKWTAVSLCGLHSWRSMARWQSVSRVIAAHFFRFPCDMLRQCWLTWDGMFNSTPKCHRKNCPRLEKGWCGWMIQRTRLLPRRQPFVSHVKPKVNSDFKITHMTCRMYLTHVMDVAWSSLNLTKLQPSHDEPPVYYCYHDSVLSYLHIQNQ